MAACGFSPPLHLAVWGTVISPTPHIGGAWGKSTNGGPYSVCHTPSQTQNYKTVVFLYHLKVWEIPKLAEFNHCCTFGILFIDGRHAES